MPTGRSDDVWALKFSTVLWLTLVGHCAADTLYDQPLNNAVDRGAFSWYNGQEIADQLTLSSSATIERITWYGSFYQTNLSPTVTQSPFVIRFFNSVPSSAQLQSLGDPTTASAQPFYQREVIADVFPSGIPFNGTPDPTDPDPTRITYEFTTDLSGLTLTTSTEYWISILSSGPDHFRWADSTSTSADYSVYRFVYLGDLDWDGASNLPVNGPTGEVRENLAFALYGNEVPEPNTLLLITSVLGLLWVQNKRRRLHQ